MGTACINRRFRYMPLLLALMIAALAAGCSLPHPENTTNVCEIFAQKPFWYRAALKSEKKWGVPIPIMMAFMRQESNFRARAKPPRRKILWIFPGPRLSKAKGYSQAINSSWKMYRKANDYSILRRRSRFSHAIDFVGWYNNQSVKTLGLEPSDTYNLYLAYHEGWGGYRDRSWAKKLWLSPVARKVAGFAQEYQQQLQGCANKLPKSHWILRPYHWFKH